MSKIKFEQSKFGAFIQSKGFYIALAVCLLAVGAAAWTAVSTLTEPDDLIPKGQTSYNTTSYDATESGGYEQVEHIVSDVPAETSKESSESESSSSAPAPSSSETAAANAGIATTFQLPVTGDILKGYSSTELQFSTTYNDLRLHQGMDIAAEEGAVVVAAGNGTVTDIYSDALWGYTIVIDHGNGVTAYYSGMGKEIPVKKGSVVEKGKQIGGINKIPCEGADASHLHFAVKKDGKWINPADLLKK